MTQPLIETVGQRIVLQFESLEEVMKLLSPWRGVSTRAMAAMQIHHALAAAGIEVEVRVKGRPVAELGTGEMRGSLLSLLQLNRA